MAGLSRFRPMPPNSSLTTAMAKKPATAAAHSGVPDGRDSASNTPVTAALPSKSRSLRQTNSARQQDTTVTVSSQRAFH